MRKLASIAHGVALALIFVAGFGLLARLGHFGAIPSGPISRWRCGRCWVWPCVPLKRKPEWAPALWVLMPVIGGFAVWLAVTQPF